MAKSREERYQSTEDMLEDLRLVARGEAPIHARRTVHLDHLEKLEETGKTVDIAPQQAFAPPSIWTNPAVIALAGLSVIVNIVLLVLLMGRK